MLTMQSRVVASPHGGPARQLLRAGAPARSWRLVSKCITADQLEPPLYTKFSNPVYSLSTEPQLESSDGGAGRPTLNLITYASAVAIKPDRCFALSLYLGTQSYDNFKATNRGVLQILCKEHAPLFNILGKTSAKNVDKLQMIHDAGFLLSKEYGLPTIQGVACVMELTAVSDFMPCGDHDVVLCKVERYSNFKAPEDVLYTGHLRELGLMS